MRRVEGQLLELSKRGRQEPALSGRRLWDEENFAYIPLSSLIILLVILLTCASRRKKTDAYSAVEQSFENNIKEEYAIMCFPCLKKKPDLKEFEPTEDLSNQFEYIVEKYTIRKVPLLLANTVEDIIERQEELETKTALSQPKLIKEDFVNFQVSQEVYNVQRIPPCITIAANPGCPGRKAIKERPKPSDVLESMSPISRSPVKNHNYVVIPTKGSLRHKDIMMTKREITNQYLNNFSSVFVDNLKDQVPKDPERFPSLSRPYTGAFKNIAVDENIVRSKSVGRKKHRRSKTQKVAYAFPGDDVEAKEENSLKEEPSSDTDSTQEHTTDALESEFQEEAENDTAEFTGKSKSFVLLNDSDSIMDGAESLPNPFKTPIKSSVSETENNAAPKKPPAYISTYVPNKEDWPNTKNVTYEDIQALDVGYEFTSCEKLGVKPKMTRIHYPLETEKLKETLKFTFGDSSKTNKKSCPQDQPLAVKTIKTVIIKPPAVQSARLADEPATHYGKELMLPLSEKNSSKSVLTETSFLPYRETKAEGIEMAEALAESAPHDRGSTHFIRAEDSKSRSLNEHDLNNAPSATAIDSVTEISKLYDLSMPVSHRRESSMISEELNQPIRPPMASKSRSFQEASGTRNEGATEVKGKVYLPYPIPNSTKKDVSRLDEPDTETTCSLYSRESKTSSAVTTAMSSEVDEGKRATLRWKIVIKHHREDDSSRKNVNVNIRH